MPGIRQARLKRRSTVRLTLCVNAPCNLSTALHCLNWQATGTAKPHLTLVFFFPPLSRGIPPLVGGIVLSAHHLEDSLPPSPAPQSPSPSLSPGFLPPDDFHQQTCNLQHLGVTPPPPRAIIVRPTQTTASFTHFDYPDAPSAVRYVPSPLPLQPTFL